MKYKKRLSVLLIVVILVIVIFFIYHNFYGRQLNILLISVDALRYDRLGFMGHSRKISPNIDNLSHDGVIFTAAYSQSGWTLPSMASILTGLYPHQHGATCFDRKIRSGIPTLATILHSHGYDTRAYVCHYLTSEKYDFSRGFDRFDSTVLDYGHPAEVSTSAQLTDLIISEINEIQEPYFIWAHYFDPHAKYLIHKNFHFGPSILDRYDSEIAHNDYEIGRLLGNLQEQGLLKNTIVVLTADHGEEFLEHGAYHHFTLFEEVLRVPLIIRAPTLTARSVEYPVEQIDILPTLLDLLGLKVGPDYPGRNILSESLPKKPIFVERYQPNIFRQRAILLEDYKLINIDKNPHPADYAKNFSYDKLAKINEGLFLYNISNDPGETKNILAEHESESMRLLSLFKDHFESNMLPQHTIKVSDELEERLRSLGYIK